MRFAGCWNLISALQLKTATFPFKEVFCFFVDQGRLDFQIVGFAL